MSPAQLAGLVTAILAVLGAVVGLTRYVSGLYFRVRQQRLLQDIERFKEQNAELEAKHKSLLEELAIARRIGTAAIFKKEEIDNELLRAMETLQADAGSILVRSPSFVPSLSDSEGHLVFLCLHGPKADKLKRDRVPIGSSIAGMVFSTKEAYVTADAYKAPIFYDKADKVSGYKTEDMLTYPLKHEGKTVGVIQFLNKRGEARFGPRDFELAKALAPSLSAKVAAFIENPENFQILAIATEREAEEATVMFCDLTNSAGLFQRINAALAIDLINGYLERVCQAAVDHGGFVDQTLGDGVLISYNVPRRLSDHPIEALKAALEMHATFEEFKNRCVKLGYHVQNTYNRVGVAYGPVYREMMGHPHYQRMTIMGQPVNVANNLCENAARDRNVIVIDGRIYEKYCERLIASPLSQETLGKAFRLITSAYELTGIR